jgi:hypothetical protein
MPVVTLRMGMSLNPDDIKEGDDVYFECMIQANPKPYKMSWFRDVCSVYEFIIKRKSLIQSNIDFIYRIPNCITMSRQA